MIEWLIFGPAKLLALWPDAGIAIGAMLLLVEAGLSLRARTGWNGDFFRRAPVLCGLLWLIFTFYERQIGAVGIFPGDPAKAFRIDLLVLTPVLYVFTAAAIASWWQRLRRQ